MFLIPTSVVHNYLFDNGYHHELSELIARAKLKPDTQVHLRELNRYLSTEVMLELASFIPESDKLWNKFFHGLIQYVTHTVFELKHDEFCAWWLASITMTEYGSTYSAGKYLSQVIPLTEGEINPHNYAHIYELLKLELLHYSIVPGPVKKIDHRQDLEVLSVKMFKKIFRIDRTRSILRVIHHKTLTLTIGSI